MARTALALAALVALACLGGVAGEEAPVPVLEIGVAQTWNTTLPVRHFSYYMPPPNTNQYIDLYFETLGPDTVRSSFEDKRFLVKYGAGALATDGDHDEASPWTRGTSFVWALQPPQRSGAWSIAVQTRLGQTAPLGCSNDGRCQTYVGENAFCNAQASCECPPGIPCTIAPDTPTFRYDYRIAILMSSSKSLALGEPSRHRSSPAWFTLDVPFEARLKHVTLRVQIEDDVPPGTSHCLYVNFTGTASREHFSVSSGDTDRRELIVDINPPLAFGTWHVYYESTMGEVAMPTISCKNNGGCIDALGEFAFCNAQAQCECPATGCTSGGADALSNAYNYTVLAAASNPITVPGNMMSTSWVQQGGTVQVFRVPVPDQSSSTSFTLSLGGVTADANATVAVHKGTVPLLETEDVLGECAAPNVLRSILWCKTIVAGGETGVRLNPCHNANAGDWYIKVYRGGPSSASAMSSLTVRRAAGVAELALETDQRALPSASPQPSALPRTTFGTGVACKNTGECVVNLGDMAFCGALAECECPIKPGCNSSAPANSSYVAPCFNTSNPACINYVDPSLTQYARTFHGVKVRGHLSAGLFDLRTLTLAQPQLLRAVRVRASHYNSSDPPQRPFPVTVSLRHNKACPAAEILTPAAILSQASVSRVVHLHSAQVEVFGSDFPLLPPGQYQLAVVAGTTETEDDAVARNGVEDIQVDLEFYPAPGSCPPGCGGSAGLSACRMLFENEHVGFVTECPNPCDAVLASGSYIDRQDFCPDLGGQGGSSSGALMDRPTWPLLTALVTLLVAALIA